MITFLNVPIKFTDGTNNSLQITKVCKKYNSLKKIVSNYIQKGNYTILQKIPKIMT